MKLTNRIEAIRALRAMAYAVQMNIVKQDEITFILHKGTISLLECKEYIDAVMALGVQQALSNGDVIKNAKSDNG